MRWTASQIVPREEKERLVVVLLFLAHLAYGLVVFNRTQRLVHDDGHIAALAHLISRGLLPYKDFFLNFPPGTFFVQSLLQWAFGYELIVGRWYVLAEHLLLLVLIWRISVRAIPPGWGRLCPLAFLFFGPLFSHPFNSLDALVISYISLLLVIRHRDGEQPWDLYLAGFIAAVTLLFKQNIGAATVIFVVGLALWGVVRDRKDGARAKASLLGLAVAMVSPLVLFSGYLLATGSSWQFIDNVLRSPVHLKMPFVPGNLRAFLIPNRFGLVLLLGLLCFVTGFRWRGRLWAWSWFTLAVGAVLVTREAISRGAELDRVLLWVQAGIGDLILKVPIVVCIVAVWFIVRQPQDAGGGDQKKLIVLTAFSFLHLVAAGATGADWPHFSMVFPFVYVLMGRLFAEAVEKLPAGRRAFRAADDLRSPGWKGRPVVLLAGATGLILYGLVMNVFVTAFGDRADSRWRGNPVKALLAMRGPGLPGLKGMRLSQEEGELLASLARYIEAHTRPSDEIFAFPMGATLYPITRRISTSYYSHFYIEVAAPDWNERTIDYLKAKRPRYVVIADIPAYASSNERDRVLSVDGRAEELWDYIKMHFSEAAHFGRYVILRDRGVRDNPGSSPAERSRSTKG